MAERFELQFELTREDWLAVNEACMRESPVWGEAQARHSRAMRRQAMGWAPILVGGAALFVGSRQGTQGMYVEGAIGGACLAALMFFAMPRIDVVEKAKKAHTASIRRMDFSAHIGMIRIVIDETGVDFHSPNRQMKLSWLAVAPSKAGEYVLLQEAGSSGIVIPPRVFDSEAAAKEFLDRVSRWWQAGQRPHAERLEGYLAGRDCACPKCKYNLRGLRGEACPECGEVLRVEELMRM